MRQRVLINIYYQLLRGGKHQKSNKLAFSAAEVLVYFLCDGEEAWKIASASRINNRNRFRNFLYRQVSISSGVQIQRS